jgi:hypothetical protein
VLTLFGIFSELPALNLITDKVGANFIIKTPLKNGFLRKNDRIKTEVE